MVSPLLGCLSLSPEDAGRAPTPSVDAAVFTPGKAEEDRRLLGFRAVVHRSHPSRARRHASWGVSEQGPSRLGHGVLEATGQAADGRPDTQRAGKRKARDW